MCAPDRPSAWSTVVMAAMPEATATAQAPPSSEARHSSSAARVGLAIRE